MPDSRSLPSEQLDLDKGYFDSLTPVQSSPTQNAERQRLPCQPSCLDKTPHHPLHTAHRPALGAKSQVAWEGAQGCEPLQRSPVLGSSLLLGALLRKASQTRAAV